MGKGEGACILIGQRNERVCPAYTADMRTNYEFGVTKRRPLLPSSLKFYGFSRNTPIVTLGPSILYTTEKIQRRVSG